MSNEPHLPVVDRPYPPDLNPFKVGLEWFKGFAAQVEDKNVAGIISSLRPDAWWRDTLAMTFDFRTFSGPKEIGKFLQDRLEPTNLKNMQFMFAGFDKSCPGITWVQGMFTFEVGDVSAGNGMFRLVPDNSTGDWKAFTIYTNLTSFKDFPEKTGPFRDNVPNHGKWLEKRRKETEFEDEDPYVVVIGGGHSGLDVAARLKFLDVPTLLLEKEARIGDNWLNRYESLCLHDPVYFNHMPYIPFPETWPMYSPSQKLAGWLEFYAHSLELNVWTSSTVTLVTQDPETKKFKVVVRRGDIERVLHPAHVVFAVGLMSGAPDLPDLPGKAEFEGNIMHSSQHKTARENIGKKVVVVSAGNSAHDICADHVDYGVDVTMYQRSPVYIMSQKATIEMFRGFAVPGVPTEIKDLVLNSYPRNVVKWVNQRNVKTYAEIDKELLAGFDRVGFKYNFGEDGSGLLTLAWTRAGGYYINVGASEMVVDGRVKLKNDSVLQGFTKKGLKFEDGSELEADVVVFATGFESVRNTARRICGKKLGDRIKDVWGLDDEGELRSVWRDCGVEGLWFQLGNLATARFYSQHVALQIKAMKEGIFGERYSRKR